MTKSGMILDGRLGSLASVAENPLAPTPPAGGVDVKQIVLLDDGLRRTYLSWHQVQDGSLRESDATANERIRINQNIAKGRRRVGSIRSILGVTPFDSFGHRIFSVQTPKGRVDIVQGITEITPLYTRLEGLQGTHAVQWDSRIATSSIPRETLSQLLRKAAPSDAEGRLQIVRLLFSSERYNDARLELEQAMQEFPELAEFDELLTQLRQMSAQRLVDEIELRKAAGQHDRVQAILANFPSEQVATQVLQQVNQLQTEYRETDGKITAINQAAQSFISATQNPRWRGQLESIRDEIAEELNIHGLSRFSDFTRFTNDADMPSENKLALLVSGWVVGAGSASQNLSEALSLVRTRDLVTDYLNSQTTADRTSILDRLAQEEGGTPNRVAEILEQLPPPKPTKAQQGQPPGYFQLQTPGKKPFTYEVQLPNQYDPYRRYPVIVTLNGAGRTPGQQIDWWSGVYHEGEKMRLGQASRHGYIVIAPHWASLNQIQYDYATRAHAAVLASLRDAFRRFSIDSDRVFLSGHSMGGDAAWDIGLSHPDLWAGVIPIVAAADHGPNFPKYVSRYWPNAEYIPLYFIAGELDGDKMAMNGRDLDRYMTRPNFDMLLVEYIGRGHEHFYDEIHRLFAWMQLHRRDFYRREFDCVSMRESDSFFWCLEMSELPKSSVASHLEWPLQRGTRPTEISFKIDINGAIRIKTGARNATLWLAPEWHDFSKPLTVYVNGRSRNHTVSPDLETMLEDARTRCDRQHPFWGKLELETNKRR